MRELVENALKGIQCYSPEATELILGTAAQESAFGKYRRQLGGGPARGIFQMEPRTHNDIVNNFLRYHNDLAVRVLKYCNLPKFDAYLLEFNDDYACCFARLQYWRYPDRIGQRLNDWARLWKLRYNTPFGAGTEDEFVHNYNKYVMGIV